MTDAGQGWIYSGGKKLRCGYTTGSCAAGAAKAAAKMLFERRVCTAVHISTPAGKTLILPVEQPLLEESAASCAVRKDGGDDADATDGLLIFAKAERIPGAGQIVICGGPGVGVVTKPGLDRPVGDAAINSVPRSMIRREVGEVLDEEGAEGGVRITLSVPGGEEAARKTFNGKLGITGGISILGTSGIVEPMSEKALLDTIRAELSQRRALRDTDLIIAPGNFGLKFLAEHCGIVPERVVICSNFLGDTLDMAVEDGFSSALIVGHIGKLVKVGSGIFNTHSHIADGRMETLAACGVEAGADEAALRRVLSCNTTEDAIESMMADGIWDVVLSRLLVRIDRRLSERVRGELKTGCVLFSSRQGFLGQTDAAGELLARAKADV